MAVYTISPDFLRNIDKNYGLYFTDILLVFTIRANPLKISVDKDGVVISNYTSIENNKDIIKIWLDLMSFNPKPFEIIDVGLHEIECEETRFLTICRETKSQNKMIIFSHQYFTKFHCAGSVIDFHGKPILLLDRDTAKLELNRMADGNTYIISGSQVAIEKSTITRSNNK